MKKRFVFVLLLTVLFVTACGGSKGSGNKSSRTAEELLDAYTKAYAEADFDTMKDILPSFMVEANRDIFNKEKLEQAVKQVKEEYGDDFHITYEITKKEIISDDELKSFNDRVKQYVSDAEEASECYSLEGTITFTGSKSTDSDPLYMGYCKYSDGWYLVDD